MCEHPKTVEIYKSIFKCSTCGKIWDEANELGRIQRQQGLQDGERMRARKAKRIEHYKRKARHHG